MEETFAPELSSDVRLSVMFPDYPTKGTSVRLILLTCANCSISEFPAGSLVTAVVGFHNKADTEYTITAVEGSLRYPMEFSYRLFNVRHIPTAMP